MFRIRCGDWYVCDARNPTQILGWNTRKKMALIFREFPLSAVDVEAMIHGAAWNDPYYPVVFEELTFEECEDLT